jgi:hypothetical protein
MGAIECGNHPGILDITYGQCSMLPNAARHANSCRLRAWPTGVHAGPGRAQNVRPVSDRLLSGSLVATRGGERLSERNASISTSWRPCPYRSRTPQRGSAMFRDHVDNYGSRPFARWSFHTPRQEAGQASRRASRRRNGLPSTARVAWPRVT